MPRLTVAISSRALFNLSESHALYLDKGVKSYAEYQIRHEHDILAPGSAFNLVKKLLRLNEYLGEDAVEVILLSRNSADTGLRIFHSIDAHGLAISRAAFTSGESPYRYAKAFSADLFLSLDQEDVCAAHRENMAAALLWHHAPDEVDSHEVRIAFDGDSVLFSGEAESIFDKEGLKAFSEQEKNLKKVPLPSGPFRRLHKILHDLQELGAPIRTALVTARGAPAHERVIHTFRDWSIRIDEVLFLGGQDKGSFLEAFGADIFFDDRESNCQDAACKVPTGQVIRELGWNMQESSP